MEDTRQRKVFVVNTERSIVLTTCYSVTDSDKEPCPAFASCFEDGDVCQIEDRSCYSSERKNGFPTWCPLDEIK